MIMIELEALNWSFQLLLYIRHDFGHVKSGRQKRPSHHAYRVTVHSYLVPVTDFADASHSKSAKSAATTVSYGIFSSENACL